MKPGSQVLGPKAQVCWKCVVVVCCAFFYFLIFAQFALLHRIEMVDAKKEWLQPVMFAMGLGGVAGSLIAWGIFRPERLRLALLVGFLGCAGMGCLVQLDLGFGGYLFVGAMVGLFLGGLTVTIVPALRIHMFGVGLGYACGVGVGMAYFLSNLPWIFKASAVNQSLIASVVCLVGAMVSVSIFDSRGSESLREVDVDLGKDVWCRGKGMWLIVLFFALLVWLDSAAFYVIQETDTLKAETWGGEVQLWLLAVLHLLAALVSGWMLGKGRLFSVLLAAMVLLSCGSLVLVLGGGRLGDLAAAFYVCGVSLYSCALVAFGAMKGEGLGLWPVVKRASVLFAIAGWIGSGMGIGMARDLNTVPLPFIGIALCGAIGITILMRRGTVRESAR